MLARGCGIHSPIEVELHAELDRLASLHPYWGIPTEGGGARRGVGMMRAALYTRVSTEEQAEHGYSIDEQERLCRKYIDDLESNGWTYIDTFRGTRACRAS